VGELLMGLPLDLLSVALLPSPALAQPGSPAHAREDTQAWAALLQSFRRAGVQSG